jgi:large exoprotein involved in heme utilization and adhesion
VTGTEGSDIGGTLGVAGSADLFLLNPNGIRFGAGAQLDIAGMFVATTAEGLSWGQGLGFSAVNPQAAPSLTVNITPGLQRGTGNRSISSQGPLQVGGDLRLAAGHLDLSGALVAGGDVTLESWVGDIGVGGIRTANPVGDEGDIVVDSQGEITASGVINASAPSGMAGDVTLRANGDISFRDTADVFASGAVTGNITLNSGGDISLDGNQIQTIMTTNQPNLVGGNIEIGAAGNISIINGGRVLMVNSGSGHTGDISIQAQDNLRIEGENSSQRRSGIESVVTSHGNSGVINVQSDSLTITKGGFITAITSGRGNVGKIIININDSILLVGESSQGYASGIHNTRNTNAQGDSSGIDISANSLTLQDGALISSISGGSGSDAKIKISLQGDLLIEGLTTQGRNGEILNFAAPNRQGDSGGIEIRAKNLTLRDGGTLSTTTFGQGNSGKISLFIDDMILLEGQDNDVNTLELNVSRIVSAASTGATGSSAGIEILADFLILREGTLIIAATDGAGDAGPIDITVNKDFIIEDDDIEGTPGGVFSGVGANAIGNGGEIAISAGSLFLRDGNGIATSTTGQGDAGTITLRIGDRLQLEGRGSQGNSSGISSDAGINLNLAPFDLERLQKGGRRFEQFEAQSGTRAGLIDIDAPHIVLKDGAIISSSATREGIADDIQIQGQTLDVREGSRLLSQTRGREQAGNIILNLSESVFLEGAAGGIFANTAAGSSGRGGSIAITTPNLSLTNGVELSASTAGRGNAGDIRVSASQVNLSNNAIVQTNTTHAGNAGDISFNTATLHLNNGSRILADTSGNGSGGTIRVNAPEQIVLDAGEVSASTANSGDAGNINLTTTDLTLTNGALLRTNTFSSGDAGNIKVDVTNDLTIDSSSIEARTEDSSTGNGGDIDIDPILTTITNDGRVAVDSAGSGIGGDIRLVSDNLVLSNLGRITAETRSSNGGNITLTVPELLRLLDNSVISTEAGTAQAGGNGGNITIDAGFLIGATNSDITTNAFSGNGGVVTINAQGIINLIIENSDAPRTDLRNNVTANSIRANVGILAINADTVDVTELPDTPQVSNLIDRSCTGSDRDSSFTIQGGEGLPPQPNDIIQTGRPLADLGPDLAELAQSDHHQSSNQIPLIPNSPTPITEAQTIQFGPNGKVHLVAQQPQALALSYSTCQ